jgi:hypothetical protein
MKDKPTVKKEENKKVDSDEEFWKKAAEITAEDDVQSEDEDMVETRPGTPTFDDMPSPVVNALLEQLEAQPEEEDDDDDDTHMIPDNDTDTDKEVANDRTSPEPSEQDIPANDEEEIENSSVVRTKVPGENTFSHDCVKTWSPARIHAWEIRRLVS